VIADYIRQDAPRLLNDLEAVVRTYVLQCLHVSERPCLLPIV
jgi:hypothetical protein